MTTEELGILLREHVEVHEDGSQERWRDVVGFETYYCVSDRGRVKSLTRRVPCPDGRWNREVKGRILTIFSDGEGRPFVNLWKDNKGGGRDIGPLVLKSFVGPPPDGMECCHFPDRDPFNNNLTNLRWDTRQGNVRDMLAHGTHRTPNLRGEDVYGAKLTKADVREIKRRHRAGESGYKIKQSYPVSYTAIKAILRGKTWSHVE